MMVVVGIAVRGRNMRTKIRLMAKINTYRMASTPSHPPKEKDRLLL